LSVVVETVYPKFNLYPAVYPAFDIYPGAQESDMSFSPKDCMLPSWPRDCSLAELNTDCSVYGHTDIIGYPVFNIYPAVYPYLEPYPAVAGEL
jgi:hypothetical protein